MECHEMLEKISILIIDDYAVRELNKAMLNEDNFDGVWKKRVEEVFCPC